jgi:alpha-2-macroglobulin
MSSALTENAQDATLVLASSRSLDIQDMRIRSGLLALALLTIADRAGAQTVLSVVNGQPTGELAKLEQAAEIRVRFSEPMVPIGRLPEEVTAPFFSIRPAITGTFRWAGPTLLVFTPDPKKTLPNSTRYDVTIAASATALSGRTLGRPYSFAFTTPTVRLLQTQWYRLNGRYDQPIVIPLRFNQPVRPADVAAHMTARYERHGWERPAISAAERARMGADDTARFDAKVAASLATASSEAAVQLRLAADWDKTKFPPSSDLVVLQSLGPPALDGWVRLTIDNRLPGVEGSAPPPAPQSFTIQLEPALFVDNFRCQAQCDADDYNGAHVRSHSVSLDALARAAIVRDITNRDRETPIAPQPPSQRTRARYDGNVSFFSLEDLGFDRQKPASTYAISIDRNLRAADGQTLGYMWTSIVENWHDRAFSSFGDGHGVWETGGGQLPFYARNFADVWQWARGISLDRLMPTIVDLKKDQFHATPPGDGMHRRLGGAADKILSFGLDISSALTRGGTGLVWAAVKRGDTIPKARPYGEVDTVASVVQVTNLGINVKDSPQNTLVFVTRLDSGAPVPGADVSIIKLDNSVAWSGRTDEHGLALAPQLKLRHASRSWEFRFIVTAAKDGDVAYVGNDWTEGIEPYEFGNPFDLNEAEPLLRGTAFTDRGVYKLGEEIHVKAILRRDTPSGIELVPTATNVYVAVRDSQNKVIDRRTVATNAWSSTEWTLRLPATGALGNYQVLATLDKETLEERAPKPRREDDEDEHPQEWRKVVRGGFLVAAYRRPEFRVDTTLSGDVALAGAPLKGVVQARYLFGAAMASRPVTWSYSRSPVFSAPAAVLNQYPADRFTFVGCCEQQQTPQFGRIGGKTATLDVKGLVALDLETQMSDGLPYQYTLEGDVEDVSRQHIAGSASFVVHPAPWYVGLKRPSLFVDQKDGLSTTVVAVRPDGKPEAGVKVDLTLVEVQWHSVRRAEGNGFYTWDTERKEAEVGHFSVTTAVEPVALTVPVPTGGSFFLRAVASEGEYRSSTRLPFYSLGSGYTAWARYDHNRIDLVPERETYKPGETARLMIQSPWEQATALLTVEREGIRSHSQFALTSTQQTVTVPITAADIPNLFVSVLLVKGRTTATATPDDTSDPGKPSFRLGYARLTVEDSSKRLSVSVRANKEEFRPAGTAKVEVQVNDASGKGVASETTLWAVDYGVLSLTAFRTPDVLRSVYVPKALEVMNEDSRQRIVSRRALTPKGADSGGGGGADAGVSQLRKDFRVLAFWLGSVTTDSRGHASTEIKLPESLTTYRIMAVSGDKVSRFGSGESEIRINKPVVLKPAFPRFLVRGDKAYFGSVVTSQLKQAGSAVVTMRSLDPEVLQITGEDRRVVQIDAGGSTEVRFDVVARAVGRARVQTTVKIGSESDAFEDTVPVQVTVSPESVAAYGEAAPDARQTVAIPTGIVPGVGGLHVELSSTALVGLGDGARYVVEYPFGCVEQRASRTFVLATASDLGEAFRLPGIDARALRTEAQKSLVELEKFQCPSGGFAFWPGECMTVSPFLTSYVLHVFQTAAALKYDVKADVMRRGYDYLEQKLAEQPPVNEGWWPMYTAWESFAIRTLVDGGRNQDSNINRLFSYLDRMPVFALAYLHDALMTKKETGARPAELQRRMANAVLPEAGTAHIEELNDPYLLWFWNSNVRSTALVLSSLARGGAEAKDVSPMARWLVAARKNGRWGNTQENAVAMQALVNYYRKYETTVPNFTAMVKLGTTDLVRAAFKGRSTDATTADVPMGTLTRTDATTRELTLRRDGEGTLFYAARLTYAPDAETLKSIDGGFHVERQYASLVDGKTGTASTAFKAGDLVRVTLAFDLPKERRFVAVTDPVPAGFEPVESWFATTAADVARETDQQDGTSQPAWEDVWKRGTFDHVERHDDRVLVFATRLTEGHHEFSYVVRATTAGTFVTAPARVEEMYEPEVLGRTSTQTIEVRR